MARICLDIFSPDFNFKLNDIFVLSTDLMADTFVL